MLLWLPLMADLIDGLPWSGVKVRLVSGTGAQPMVVLRDMLGSAACDASRIKSA
jgi:hypothetical protein